MWYARRKLKMDNKRGEGAMQVDHAVAAQLEESGPVHVRGPQRLPKAPGGQDLPWKKGGAAWRDSYKPPVQQYCGILRSSLPGCLPPWP